MSGFQVWLAGPYGTSVFAVCMLALGLVLGEWDGVPRGRRRERADRLARREEAKAMRQFQLLREPEPVPMPLLVSEDPASSVFWHHLGQDRHARREAMARRTHPVYREKRTSTAAFLDPPEVAYNTSYGATGWEADEERPDVLVQINADLDRFLAEVVHGGQQ